MDFEDTVAAIARTRDQIKELQEHVEDLYATLPQSQKAGAYPAGRYILKVRDNYRFDAATAIKVLPTIVLQSILVSKPDSAQARKVLSGDDYAKCQKKIGVVREVEEVTDEV